ncbi:MAG: hypothetical protein HY248_01310 [Fimbriimonas ginsengisoli]|nr:hypothetical protein [Fimbriimonas ginsengisoli]
MRRAAYSLVELLVGALILCLLLVGVYGLMAAQAVAQSVAYDMTASSRDARAALDLLADHLRGAQLCTSGGVVGSALGAGTASDITYYTTNAAATVRYHLSGTTLVRTVSGTNTNALVNVNSLSFTYYTSATYNSATLTTTTNPNAPTNAELPALAAIRITASTTTDGRTVQYSTLVRLRNSPIRANLKGN